MWVYLQVGINIYTHLPAYVFMHHICPIYRYICIKLFNFSFQFPFSLLSTSWSRPPTCVFGMAFSQSPLQQRWWKCTLINGLQPLSLLCSWAQFLAEANCWNSAKIVSLTFLELFTCSEGWLSESEHGSAAGTAPSPWLRHSLWMYFCHLPQWAPRAVPRQGRSCQGCRGTISLGHAGGHCSSHCFSKGHSQLPGYF